MGDFMKKVLFGFAITAFSCSFMMFFPQQAPAQTVSNTASGKKVLVVYYSNSGNTKQIAQYIRDAAKADIFEIQTENPYPSQYKTLTDQAKEEINAGYKPKIKNGVENIRDYDIIFIGSPSWWSTIAPPVATFLSEHDLSGKTIIPFVTHGGTGMGNNARDTAKLAPNAAMLTGKAFRGGSVKNAQKEVDGWVEQILK
jgi:flavodoxin